MASTANIKNKYLKMLDTFKSGNIQTKEQQHIQALSLLTQAFDNENYIHMPVDGERATRAPLDEAFKTIQANHKDIEAGLAALVANTNSLEDDLSLNEDELNVLLEVLKAELTVRALNTSGQEQYERQITESFGWPLTLAPTNSTNKTYFATDIEWVPNDPLAIAWVGDIESSASSPTVSSLADLLVGKSITVQMISWSLNTDISPILLNALTAALANLTDGQPLDENDFFIISEVGVDSPATDNHDGSGTLKIKLAVPELISKIGLDTVPSNAIDHVVIINHQGVPTMYQMIDSHAYIRPTVVKEIHFNITGGVGTTRLSTFFTAILDHEDVEGGSPHITGHFSDRISHNVLNTDVALTGNRGEAAAALKKQISAKTRRDSESNRKSISGLQSATSKDMRSVGPETARDNIRRPGDGSKELKTNRNKAGGVKGKGSSREDIVTKPGNSVSRSPGGNTRSFARDARKGRLSSTTPNDAVIVPSPPPKTSNNTTPSSTKDNGK